MPSGSDTQVSPPFSLTNTPDPEVPTYTVLVFAGSIASANTRLLVSPLLSDIQFCPPSALFRTPLDVPAYMVDGWTGSIASARTNGLIASGVAPGVHVWPPLVV